jgi:iron complex outermembrane receptor protein
MTFIHWLHKSWAVFGSLGKQIRIALLPLSYFLGSVFTLNAQTDTVEIENVEIVSSRVPTLFSESPRVILIFEKEDIKAMPVQSLQDLLEYISGVDVRQRGNEGVQADIGINGGTFDQTLILLNGFKMNDVQTGHHNMNLPIDIESIEKIEILEGPGNRVFGVNSYSGAVNIITDTQKTNRLKLSLKGGQYGLMGGNVSASVNKKRFNNFLSLSGNLSKGYLPDETVNNTDFKNLNLFFETTLKTKVADFVIQTGFSDKSFGANSFYTPSYPWQYENTKSFFTGYKTTRHGKNYNFMKSFYWRRHQDRFELFRESKYERMGDYFVDDSDTAKFAQGIYADRNYYKGHNYHKTNLIASELKYDIKTSIGKTAVGAEYNHAYIQSNVLSIEMQEPVDVLFEPFGNYTKAANRFNVNLYAEHVYAYRNFMVGAGFSSNYNSDFNWNFAGGVDVSYDFCNRSKLFASINQANRLPTYTDLYYDGPTNKGNPNLQPEHAVSYETGFKYLSPRLFGQINAFRRDGKNTIDWVHLPDSVEWQPQNITQLTTYGVGISVVWSFKNNPFFKKISGSYTWLTMTKESGDYISKYVMDYLKHKLVVSMQHTVYKTLTASLVFRFEDREGTYSAYDSILKAYTGEEEYDPFTIMDVKLNYKMRFLSAYIEINNLFNTEYYDYGNIKMPGIWVKAGIEVDFFKH